MKKQSIIKHTLKLERDGVTISGNLLDVKFGTVIDCYGQKKKLYLNTGAGIFEEERADCGIYVALSKNFNIRSISYPSLDDRCLHLFGHLGKRKERGCYENSKYIETDANQKELRYTFKTSKRAIEVGRLIDLISYDSEKIIKF